MTTLHKRIITEQHEYYGRLLEQDIETKKLRHDIQAHLIVIYRLTQEKRMVELEKYLSEMLKDWDKLEGSLGESTGLDVIDIVIYELKEQYKDSGVELLWKGGIPAELKISKMDMVTLFSNLLKNAFEAAEKCEKNKMIKVKMNSDGTSFFISVENNYTGKVLMKNNKLLTIKRDNSNHGYGIGIIRRVVDKYGGEIIVSTAGNVFLVEIIFINIFEG